MSGNYYAGQYVSRPGILTSLAIISIIVASVSMLVDFGDLFFSKIVLQFSSRTNASAVATQNVTAMLPPTGVTHTAGSEYVAPQGLSSAQRRIVIDGLEQVRSISADREKELDGLLADVGQSVIRISPDYLTTDRVAAYVTDTRNIPSGSGGAPDDMFILGSGRLQLTDRGAIFFPENSPSPIRSGGGSYTDSAGLQHLASTQIAAVVERVKSLATQPLTDAQISGLEGALQAPGQTIIAPSDSVAEAAAQVISVQILPDGTAAVTTSSTTMSFGPDGQMYPGVMSATQMQGPWGPGRRTGPRVDRRDATLLFLDAILSFLGAGFLLACAIMLLRNSAISRWMYIAYGAAKILMVILSCYAVYSVAQEIALANGSPDPGATATAWMLITALPAAALPIAILVVMNLKATREFLGTPVVGRIF
jgi:hypothetical protein